MRRAIFFALLLGTAVGNVRADMPPAPSAAPLKTVFVWAMGKDPSSSKEVELDIQMNLAKRDVAGVSAAKIFPNGLPDASAEVISAVRAQGCDSFLVVHRISTIRWDTDPTGPTLKSFLAHRSKVLNPKNQVEAEAAAPIVVANAYGNADWQIDKGEYLVFDMKTLKLLRRGDSAVKSAKDLPQSKYYQLVADKIVDMLAKDGLVPAGKK